MKTRRLLVLDDDGELRKVLARVLKRFEVTTCATVAEARALLFAQRFHAVVSDVNLADGDGVALFHEVVRAHPEQGKRYVFVTGSVDAPGVRARLQETGAPFLMKPFSPVALINHVTEIVAGAVTPSEGVPRV